MHIVKEANMFVAKMNLLMKRIEDCEKMSAQAVQAMDACMTCEGCGETGHSYDLQV
jgi:hypothetical protein